MVKDVIRNAVAKSCKALHTLSLLHDQSPHWLNYHCFPSTSTDVRIGFDPTQYTVNEETGEVELTIVKLDVTSREVSVIFSTDDGTGMTAATGKYVLIYIGNM